MDPDALSTIAAQRTARGNAHRARTGGPATVSAAVTILAPGANIRVRLGAGANIIAGSRTIAKRIGA